MREAKIDQCKIKEKEQEESKMSLSELEEIRCEVEAMQLDELVKNLRIVMATIHGKELHHSQPDPVSYSYLVCYT